MSEILGKCVRCGSDVVLVEFEQEGWRFCWGCDARGPEVVLVGEDVDLADLEDDTTVVELDNSDLVAACRGPGS
jgi:hypothetical protein